MPKLMKWEDIDKELFQKKFTEQKLTAGPIHVLRTFESIFEGGNEQVEAYQCGKCGNLFMIGKELTSTLNHEGDEIICKFCAGEEDENQEKVVRYAQMANATALIQEWEKLPNQNKENFDLLKRYLDGILEFETIREMYVNYHNLSKKIREENSDLGNHMDKKYQEIFDKVFEESKKNNPDEFVKLLFGLNHQEEHEIQETINMLEAAIVRAELEYWLPKIMEHTVFVMNIKTKKELDRYRLKYRLLIYGQLVEFGFIFDVLYNLTRIAKGKKFESDPFPPDGNGRPIFPDAKILAIKNENSSFDVIFNKYFVSVLRNAVAHAKYAIDDKFVYKTDRKKWKIAKTEVLSKSKFAKALFRYMLNRLSDEQSEIMDKGYTAESGDHYSATFSENILD